MIRIKLMFTIFFSITLASCQNKQESIIEGHTFYKITETESGKILYQPCDAKIETYKFYKDFIYHNWGQEYDIINQLYFSEDKDKNVFIFKGHNTNSDENENIVIQKLNIKSTYWKINNEIFIDSLDMNRIQHIKQAKEECEDVISLELMLQKNDKTWSNNCNSDKSYIYFSSVNGIGGRIVLRGNYTIKINTIIINENEINILFHLPMRPPYPDNMSNFSDYSEEEPIAKIKRIGNNIQFHWFGYYNKKTRKRIHLENPFTNKIDKDIILLQKCE